MIVLLFVCEEIKVYLPKFFILVLYWFLTNLRFRYDGVFSITQRRYRQSKLRFPIALQKINISMIDIRIRLMLRSLSFIIESACLSYITESACKLGLYELS